MTTPDAPGRNGTAAAPAVELATLVLDDADGRRDLTAEDERASLAGLVTVSSSDHRPPDDHVRRVATYLLLIFGACLISILLLTTAIAWFRADTLKDVIGFFSTVIATLGTLLGGVVAFYFARR